MPGTGIIFVRWPSVALFPNMRLDPDYIQAQTLLVKSAEMYGNFVTVKRESRPV